MCEFVSQGAFEIPLVENMTFRFYLIKRDFLRVFKFYSLYFWCHLRYKLTQHSITEAELGNFRAEIFDDCNLNGTGFT